MRRVVEYGGGFFSTPLFLDRWAFPDLKELITVENNPEWIKKLSDRYGSDRRFRIVPEYHFEARADLALVDDETTAERLVHIKALAANNGADLSVVHDSEQPLIAQALNAFHSVYHFQHFEPFTAVGINGGREGVAEAMASAQDVGRMMRRMLGESR